MPFQAKPMPPMSTHPCTHTTSAFKCTRRSLSLLVLSLGLTMAACSPQAAASDSVTLDFARAEFEAGRAILIDNREPSENATGVAKGAQLLPMRQLGARLAEIPTATDMPVLLICNTQNRSSSTLSALRERGYALVRFVQGGMSEWNRRGWPMVKP